MSFRSFRLRVPPRERREPKIYEVDPEQVKKFKEILAKKEEAKAARRRRPPRLAARKPKPDPAEVETEPVELDPEPEEVSEPAPEEETEEQKENSHMSTKHKFKELMTPERAAQWAQWRREGKPYDFITQHDELQPSYPTVKTYLKKFGYGYDGQPLAGTEPVPVPTPEPEPEPTEPEAPATLELEGLVDIAEAARRLDLHEESVRRHLRNGVLTGEKVHGKWLVCESSLDYFVGETEEVTDVAPPAQEPAELAPAPEADVLTAQLAAVQQLMQSLQADDVQVSGKVVVSLNIEVGIR